MDKNTIAIVILSAILLGLGVIIADRTILNKRTSLGEGSLAPTSQGSPTNQQPTTARKDQPVKKTYSQPPAMQLEAGKTYQAILNTTEGKITIDLNAEATPITVNNFVSLARDNFYDDTIFHRTIEGFMIQGGDPEGTGAGGPGYRFDDEDFEGDYDRGVVAMANAGENTNGSQFFIMHQDYPLPANYVIFGKVSQGLEVVDAIATAETTISFSGENSKPINPVMVESVEIIEK